MNSSTDITVSLSVREFAVPVPRLGSIEAHSGFGPATLEGQEAHLQLQGARKASHSNYEPEVRISAEFKRAGYLFRVSGRMDGIFLGETAKIEEIKSCYQLPDLEKKLLAQPMEHPYQLQLKTYGYFYFLNSKKKPKLSFHLVSLRNGSSTDLMVKWKITEYEAWLELRLDALVKEVEAEAEKVARRQTMATCFQFPFSRPRSGQIELIQRVKELGKDEHLMLQAPTGLGKTAGVLFPVLQEALSRGQSVVYVTPKNSQHLVAEDALRRFRITGSDVRSLTLTAKSKICFQEEPLCDAMTCEYAEDYYTKVSENDLLKKLQHESELKDHTFRSFGELYRVCPYQLQMDSVSQADVVVGDYNYVFSPKSSLIETLSTHLTIKDKPNLVVDEAHNLPDRAMSYYSPILSTETLRSLGDQIKRLPKRFKKEGENLLGECIDLILKHHPQSKALVEKIVLLTEKFVEIDLILKMWLSRYLESSVEIRAGDVVLKLCRYWADFTAALEFLKKPKRDEFFTIFQSQLQSGSSTTDHLIRIVCCNAAPQMKDIYQNFNQVIAFSATLKPFDFYSRLSGLEGEKLRVAEFASPYNPSHRKLLVIPQISTKYRQREANYPKIAETIIRIASLRPGNYLVFFPSFHFLDRVIELMNDPEEFSILKQTRDMKLLEVENILASLRSRNAPTLVFAVQGGAFSEGIDYPGEMLIGAFIVGPPLPLFDIAREEMRIYYERTFGKGLEYAYTYPAMAKAVQAAGRVIRSENDRGLIVLMDGRFLEKTYVVSMPNDWLNKESMPTVSRSILKDVSLFWNEKKEEAIGKEI